MIAALVLRLVDAFARRVDCAWCRQPIRRAWGDDRYPALFCSPRCQRSWEEA